MIVEGCYNFLVLVVVVILVGVYVVIVGFVIMCIEYICSWFCEVI